ncbi:Ankyrin repeat and zinc finger domain-containing protein 1 [Acipenser ruthenus]|uniref:Ankyrin repeat and zinc finger domain-containing protein 1 n=1 Tax=Acipenser ruthenus TaxID=7906 RepID=A0A444UP63_ACIRT|nr:Ankyrin repeat and zinc finger domain-containing protein 1 [Acipenser ruthenus]
MTMLPTVTEVTTAMVTALQRPTTDACPAVVFRNTRGQYLPIYHCILHSNKMESKTVLAASLQNLSNKSVWVILMTGGGHIAGTVFQGREVLQHKTFHRYTVRAKQGMAQGLQDGQNRNHTPKSTAAALRRRVNQGFKIHFLTTY